MSLGTILLIILILLLVGAFPRLLTRVVQSIEAVTAFANHIVGIILRGSKEKMGRVAARWIVAVVTNKKAFRDRTVAYFPRDTMRSFKNTAIHQLSVTFST